MTPGDPIGVIGAGSWGTSLALHLARNNHRTILWARSAELAERLERRRRNEVYLPGIEIPENIHPTAEMSDLDDCEIVLIVVPSHVFRSVIATFLAHRPAATPTIVVSCTKGIEAGTLARMSRVCEEEATAAGQAVRYAILSGPTFATELAAGWPAASAIAARDEELADRLQRVISAPNFRLYSSTDVVGVEVAGAVKNVIAIAAGIVSGIGLGHNARAALITRGLHEMTRLGVACGGEARTFAGLAGLGDLVLTCTSNLSRNERLGEALGRGSKLDELTMDSSMVAEGVVNSASVLELARCHQVDMPITEQMAAVLYDGRLPAEAVAELMSRQLKSEIEL